MLGKYSYNESFQHQNLSVTKSKRQASYNDNLVKTRVRLIPTVRPEFG